MMHRSAVTVIVVIVSVIPATMTMTEQLLVAIAWKVSYVVYKDIYVKKSG